MKIDKIIEEIKLYAIEALKLLMLCVILYFIITLLYIYFDVPMY
jgi:hypothetical protein